MDSLNKAKDIKDLHKRLIYQVMEAKGLNPDGTSTAYCSSRKLEMVSTTEGMHGPKSPHPLNFRLTAHISDRHFGKIHLNDPKFLAVLAKAISRKLPELLDDALYLLAEEGREAFRVAEKELQNSQRSLEALRPEVQVQQELI